MNEIDLTSKEEAVKHLQHIKSTYGVDLDKPVMFVKGKYTLCGYYLGNLFMEINTKVFDKEIDEILKGSDSND